MTYTIVITRKALKSMVGIPRTDAEKIRDKIKELAIDPHPRWTEKLKGHEALRIAIGHYRVIYEVSEETKTISIVTIDHRKCVFRDLRL
jgi:mRNA interferase RelE/StbE